MNVAFQAFLLILFYLPGALFLTALFGTLSKEQELPVLSISLSGKAGLALFFAGVFHFVWVSVINRVFPLLGLHYTGAVQTFFILLSASQSTPAYAAADAWASECMYSLAAYFGTICIGAVLSGALLHWIIERFDLDRRFAALRFNPQWHYVLAAKFSADPNSVVWVNALMELEGKAVLYSGLLSEYWFAENGTLDTLLISYAVRRLANPAATEASAEPPTTAIPGETLALKFADIKNLNIQYLALVAEPVAAGAAA